MLCFLPIQDSVICLQLESAAQDIPKSTTPETGSPSASSSFTETPTKSRKRFGIPSFLNRRQQQVEPVVQPDQGSPGKNESAAVVKGGDNGKMETPRRSLKERLMSSYAGRSAPPTPEHKASSADMSLPLQDPFSGLESTSAAPNTVNDEYLGSPDPLDEVRPNGAYSTI